MNSRGGRVVAEEYNHGGVFLGAQRGAGNQRFDAGISCVCMGDLELISLFQMLKKLKVGARWHGVRWRQVA